METRNFVRHTWRLYPVETEQSSTAETSEIEGTSPLGTVTAESDDIFSFGESYEGEEDYILVEDEEELEEAEETEEEEEDEWSKFGF